MVNIINEQQQANKELLNEIETLKKQLSNKEQEITELKNLGEVSEEEEVEFKQEAMGKNSPNIGRYEGKISSL